jgi:hypothetical protein
MLGFAVLPLEDSPSIGEVVADIKEPDAISR